MTDLHHTSFRATVAKEPGVEPGWSHCEAEDFTERSSPQPELGRYCRMLVLQLTMTPQATTQTTGTEPTISASYMTPRQLQANPACT
jgi:hypothetical protein